MRIPTLGSELAVDLAVQPVTTAAGAMLLGFPAASPLPTPFGPFRLLPGLTSPLPLPVFAPDPTIARVGIAVPVLPALLGLRLAAQGLAIHDLAAGQVRATGLVVETIRN
ncbi:MAG: hypothetical protein IPK26_28555 [Planctomycetes bacterium]|nr:hypothetical protein [Planctomycetota bacterium]